MDDCRQPRDARPVDSRPVILFDGVCNLCNATVRWVAKRDAVGRFCYASLQSEAARRLLAGADLVDRPDSMVLVDHDGAHFRSAAAIRIAKELTFPWSLLAWLGVVPRPVRDAAYDLVARNRYRWFGRQESCPLPTSELARRFLDSE